MIRYPVVEEDLRLAIAAYTKNGEDWFERAETELERIRKVTGKVRFSPLWSEIKDVYIDLQHSKCAFCEKRLEAPPAGRVEQDVEHFRPKAVVKAWKVPAALTAAGVAVKQPADGADEPGYLELAYHPFNYAMSCKTCNSALKRNFFPIAGKRKSTSGAPPSAASEKPFLIYPIGDRDDDPEDLIEFFGLSPRVKAAAGFELQRALVTIEFFKLDKGKNRKTLMHGRAVLLEHLCFALRLRAKAATAAERQEYDEAIRRMTGPGAEHTNCLRCYAALYQRDPAEGEAVYETVKVFLKTVSPAAGRAARLTPPATSSRSPRVPH